MSSFLRRMVDGPIFGKLSTTVVITNALVIFLGSFAEARDMAEQLFSMPGRDVFHALDMGCVLFFCVELTLRAMAQRGEFLRSGWNWFDLLVVLPSLLPGLASVSVVRVLRVLRALRLVSSFSALRDLMQAMIQSLADAAAICGIALLCFFVFGAISHGLFKQYSPDLFGNVGTAMFTLFRLVAFADYSGVMDTFADGRGLASAVFILFYIVMSYVILNFFAAIALVYIEVVMDKKFAPAVEEIDDAMDEVMADLAEIRARLEQRARTPEVMP